MLDDVEVILTMHTCLGEISNPIEDKSWQNIISTVNANLINQVKVQIGTYLGCKKK